MAHRSPRGGTAGAGGAAGPGIHRSIFDRPRWHIDGAAEAAGRGAARGAVPSHGLQAVPRHIVAL